MVSNIQRLFGRHVSIYGGGSVRLGKTAPNKVVDVHSLVIKTVPLREKLIKTESRLEYMRKQLLLETEYSKKVFDYFNDKYPDEMSILVESL